MANDNKVNKKGIPVSLWNMALLFNYSESYVPGIPLGLQKRIFGFLAYVATKLGKHKALEKYWLGDKKENTVQPENLSKGAFSIIRRFMEGC